MTVTGSVSPPRSDRSFNERGFLLAHASSGTAELVDVVVQDQQTGSPLLSFLYHIQDWLVGRLTQALDFPDRLIASGILLGYRSGLPTDIEEAFQRTGTSHILVASGSNVVILAATLGLLFAHLGRRRRALVVSIVLLGFIVITGADASVIRATIFYELTLLAELTGRRVHAPTLVAGVGLAMMLVNPWILLFDIAFQLSFAAVVGLFLFSEYFAVQLPVWLAPKVLAPTLAAQLTTLPVLLYHFGQTSLVAPVANLLVVPMVEVVMISATATILLPWIKIIPWMTEGVTGLLLWIVERLASLPSAAVTLPTHHLLATGLAVSLVGAVCVSQYRWARNSEVIDVGR